MEFIKPELKSLVVERIKQALRGGPLPEDSELSTMCGYHLGMCSTLGKLTELPQGKSMRPALCLMVCEGLGGDPRKAVPVAASLELTHRTSLIFDDIQDNGAERNNRPSVQALWGPDQAINAGLAMSAMARLALMEDIPITDPYGILRERACWRVLEEAVIALCYGQYLDIQLSSHNKVSLTEYVAMVEGKTGALFGAACETGAIVAGANLEVQSLARKLGITLGVAFQMHDDYLGIWGNEAEVGKTANDLTERKRSLPVVLAMENFPDEVIIPMWTIVSLMNTDITWMVANRIKQWMEDKGIDKMVAQQRNEKIAQAQRLLQELPLDLGCKSGLAEFLQSVIGRKF